MINKLFSIAYNEHFNKFEKFIRPTDHVLDIGCGNGHLLNIIKKTGCEIHGCDVENRIAFKDIQFKKIENNKYPYDDNSFDVCILNFVLHHDKNPKEIMNEVNRILKTGGKVIINEDSYENFPETILTQINDRLFNFGLNLYRKFRTQHEWENIFKNASFNVDYKKTYKFFGIPPRKILYVLAKQTEH
jgi:ubiquinone/menaquinone biosynthesis C-methylase UbiE